MRIALVGNGPVDRGHGDEIDAHDLVIRFNTCRNYKKTGKRIDVLVLANGGSPGRKFASDPEAIDRKALDAAGEVWFTKHPDLVSHMLSSNPADPRCWVDFSRAVVDARLGDKPFCFIDPGAWHDACSALSISDPREPSSGMLALFHAHRTLHPSMVTLYGFTHAGSRAHDWEAERAYVEANRDWIRTVQPEPHAWSSTTLIVKAMLSPLARLMTEKSP